MIATAAFILAEAYESTHNDEYDPDGVDLLVVLAVFMVFDYQIATVIA